MIAIAPARRPARTALRHRAAALRARAIEYIPSERFAESDPPEFCPHVQRLLCDAPRVEGKPKRVSADLGAPLSLACELPLLSAADERLLFERMNHLKFHAAQRREWLSERSPCAGTMDQIDRELTASEQIRNRIVGANVRLVISIVKTFADAKNSFDELVSEGLVTLMHAVDKFDFERGFRFSTYATRAIRRNLVRLVMQRQKERQRFAQPATDAPWDLPDDRPQSGISERRWTELQGELKRLLQRLDARERAIIHARFGMEKTGRPHTLQSLAKTLGVCKGRVRQLERRALEKLQKMASEARLESPAA
jgi:RNA polymerase primary sigma factor